MNNWLDDKLELDDDKKECCEQESMPSQQTEEECKPQE